VPVCPYDIDPIRERPNSGWSRMIGQMLGQSASFVPTVSASIAPIMRALGI
jgi:hypothetical protein